MDQLKMTSETESLTRERAAWIDHEMAETRKLITESDKFVSEQRKLLAEAQKYEAAHRWFPWLPPITMLLSSAAVSAIVAAIVTKLIH